MKYLAVFVIINLLFIIGYENNLKADTMNNIDIHATPTQEDLALIQYMWLDFPKKYWQVFTFIYKNKIMNGYPDNTFKPWNYVTEKQVITVLKRAGIRTNVDINQYKEVPARMGWVEQYFLPGTIHTASADEYVTRFRLAIMTTRNGFTNQDHLPLPPISNPTPTEDELVAKRLDQWFEETRVTWNGATRQSRLRGTGWLFVKMSRMHGIPLWLALGQCWRESQFFTTGLSINYNCGWGMKDSKFKWGRANGLVKGYTDYISVEEAISAYFRLMSSPSMPYATLINDGKIKEALDIYAPPSENDTEEHYNIVMKIKQKAEQKNIH